MRRGSCATYGSSLSWDPIRQGIIATAMGALDPLTGTRIKIHVLVADKGDYYDITDDLPQK